MLADNSTQSSHSASAIDSHRSRADSSSATDMTPSPITNCLNTQPLHSPTSGAMSVASIVSPTTYNSFSQQLFEQGLHNSHSGDSRRESVDSRLGANFGDMRLASSPYASANPSTTSLQSTLAQQRNPGCAHPDRNSGPLRLSSGYQPNYQRLPEPAHTRNAPQITGPALGAIARAPEPTRGQAWAFPEEEVQRMPSAARPSDELGGSRPATSFYDNSRRNSYADSVASSQYTTESRLPVGQRRLDDASVNDFARESSEYQVSELQGEGDSPNSSQPYSRTPELRVSHKLAERKRRLEMKDLFDNLRTLQSVERGAKASKWEILSKAIAEHERQTKVIEDQKKQLARIEQRLLRSEQDLDISRREIANMRAENAQLRADLAAVQGNGSAASYHHSVPLPHQHSYMPGHDQAQHPVQQQLPPLRAIPGPESMNGVQYQHDQRTTNYR
ncbi:hlh transcription factor [Diplocarpon rosae]|nr:hlh transcription factor [Diplocarpon rosae]